MRIIAGQAKGVTIKAPKGLDTRPTSDKVREAIFSSLSEKVVGAKVLDLYAGSGALGIEALSRGADGAEFVDSSNKAINIISDNLKKTGFESAGKVFQEKAESYLRRSKNNVFDLIFMDAPYKIGLTKLAEQIELALKALEPNGLIVVEHLFKDKIGQIFDCVKSKKYGQTGVSYLEKS